MASPAQDDGDGGMLARIQGLATCSGCLAAVHPGIAQLLTAHR